jgi:hypothetical protein
MMAPHHERARLLGEAIAQANSVLAEPIDRIEVTPEKIHVWARGKHLAMTYGYANAYGDKGEAMPGSGHWWVQNESRLGQEEQPVGSVLHRLLSKLFPSRNG